MMDLLLRINAFDVDVVTAVVPTPSKSRLGDMNIMTWPDVENVDALM